MEMDIDTDDSPPIASKPYTLSLKHYDWVQKEITTLERAGIITKSISPWASPVVIIPKKSTLGEPPQRMMCVDFRRLNKQIPEVKNMSGGKGCISLVPLPKIDELYAKLQGYKVFSTLDLYSGYYHIGLSDSTKPKTAFVVSGIVKYKFNRVPFGLAQAPAYFQRLINEVLTDCNSFDFRQRYTTTTRETGKHSKNAHTTKCKTRKTIFGTCRLLQKVCATLLRYLKTPHTAHPKERRFQLDYRV